MRLILVTALVFSIAALTAGQQLRNPKVWDLSGIIHTFYIFPSQLEKDQGIEECVKGSRRRKNYGYGELLAAGIYESDEETPVKMGTKVNQHLRSLDNWNMISPSSVRRGWSSRWIQSTLSKSSLTWTSSAPSERCPSTWVSSSQRTSLLPPSTPRRRTKPYSDRICSGSTTALSPWKVLWDRMPMGVSGWQRTTLIAAHSGKV